ncbi:MAG: formylglycine-generating enzyme family protein [Sphingopyxis granuli]|uniref:formylglycine-generating enzyme family protein n=1 Tax=Sphingopyxis granuli TaxID=267128 RepID=UPI003C74B1D2
MRNHVGRRGLAAMLLGAAGLAGAAAAAWALLPTGERPGEAEPRICAARAPGYVHITAGSFMMGQEDVYAGEGPVRRVAVEGFWIDRTEVTNADYARFVAATHYVTVAERPVDPGQFALPVDAIPSDMLKPGSAVFTAPDRPSNNYADWWEYRPGANWRKPLGPQGSDSRPDRPVVHLAYADMEAYARWRGGRLPSEAEWEYAARAGGANYTAQPSEANSWQGVFPVKDFATDGFGGIAPVGCYAPNDWGLYDMIGNVWEVTSDFYAPGHDPDRPTRNPRGPAESDAFDPANPGLPSRVMKGGSYLCAPNYCQRYRPAARTGRDAGMGASNVGFRLVYDSEKAASHAN